MSDAYKEGYYAFIHGISSLKCPYKFSLTEGPYDDWMNGYRDAQSTKQ